MSEVIGVSQDRWIKIFEQVEGLKIKPDELAIQIHARYPQDFIGTSYRYLDLLQFVIELSPLPVRLSEVSLWRAEQPTDYYIATEFFDSIYHLSLYLGVLSITWWHWAEHLWRLPGSAMGVPIIYLPADKVFTYTPFGEYLCDKIKQLHPANYT